MEDKKEQTAMFEGKIRRMDKEPGLEPENCCFEELVAYAKDLNNNEFSDYLQDIANYFYQIDEIHY